MSDCCTRGFLRQIAKNSHGRKEKKGRQNLQIRQMLVTKYANIFFDVKYGIGESLYSYRRFRRLLLTAPLH